MDKTNFEKVKEFNRAFGVIARETPGLPDGATIDLRFQLLYEEFVEVSDELSVEDKEIDLPKLAKELADLLYVTYGMADSFGINLDEVFDEVHRSNMSKLGEDGKPIYREDGKVMKGPNYWEPDVKRLLYRQSREKS